MVGAARIELATIPKGRETRGSPGLQVFAARSMSANEVMVWATYTFPAFEDRQPIAGLRARSMRPDMAGAGRRRLTAFASSLVSVMNKSESLWLRESEDALLGNGTV